MNINGNDTRNVSTVKRHVRKVNENTIDKGEIYVSDTRNSFKHG